MKSQNIRLATFAAIIIGAINLASIGIVYAVFNSSHQPLESEATKELATASGTSNVNEVETHTDASGNVVDDNGQPVIDNANSNGTSTPGLGGAGNGSTTSGLPAAAGSKGSTGAGSGTGTTKPGAGPSTPTPPPPATTPSSLAKGSPCTTAVPPAGVCKSALAFNANPKSGAEPYWSHSLLTMIEQGVHSDSRVPSFMAGSIYNGLSGTIQEGTWSGSATHGIIQAAVGALGQTQSVTLTLDWNGSIWVVTGVVYN